MNQLEYAKQAVTEALGGKFGHKEARQVLEYSRTLKGEPLDNYLAALEASYGTGVVNPNVQRQVRERVKALSKNQEAGQPGTGGNKATPANPAPNLGPVNNTEPVKGTDAQKDEKAVTITDGLDSVKGTGPEGSGTPVGNTFSGGNLNVSGAAPTANPNG